MIRLIFILAVGLVLESPLARGDEVIRNYKVDITVQLDRSVLVVEEITVNAEGLNIQRGIFRDIPIVLTDDDGVKRRFEFNVLEVKRNGRPEPYAVESISGGKRIKIGSRDEFLDKGEHTYLIAYTMSNQVRFFDDYDELYWNIVGDIWQFEVQQASALIHLPKGATILDVSAFSGPYGSEGCECEIVIEDQRTASLNLASPLNPNEAFSVGIAWNKGVISPPSEAELRREKMRAYVPLLAALLGLIVVSLYYFWAWKKVGVDPKKGSIIPRYKPPEGFSPAAARYVHRMRYDNKAFVASLISMAVKGYLTIDKTGKNYILKKVQTTDEGLSFGEKKVASKIFSSSSTVEVKQSNHTKLSGAIRGLKGSLTREFRSINFRKNYGWLLPGILLSIATFIATVVQASDLVQELVGVVPMIILLLLLVGVNFLFVYLIQAPTVTGRQRMDEIEGLKMYMEVAEKDRLDMLNPPEQTPQLFEKLLPYAIALGVENKWSDKFKSVLDKAVASGEYKPSWYVGAYGFHQFHRITSDLGSGFATSISSASISPQSSSSSGSFGGGFSGGGGGGGGGGGW